MRVAGAMVAVLALLVPRQAAAQPAQGWVRLGHLSPAAPPVDVHLAPFGGADEVLVRKAGYGAVTPYTALPAGAYTVSMRAPGTGADTPAALSATVRITPGTAYSLLVFATGPGGALREDLVIDDLSAPPPGTGRLRLVQGSPTLAPVTAEVGLPGSAAEARLADRAAYGLTGPYTDLAEGRYTVRLRGGSAEPAETTVSVDVRAGSATTLLATETGGALTTTALVDSAGAAATPLRGVETGAGGTSVAEPRFWPTTAVILALICWLLHRPLLAARRHHRRAPE
ncbi:DUF4397 domain-containing protein [Actinokineospora auranticolor]|uniref:Uncharacterized protein DUF4397 n=1 Tax=Actinokineospora auranticolor TaxID=155976 RepID=A0A2S6GQU9_9PSEU|nr:DUF4397 domain-containing protein [Actinokineospora auranticolor]PPK67553.1 uncharacterized protein DUF4397 [Actinokineospora auranticolor]